MVFVSSLLNKAENICTSEFDKETGTYIVLLFYSGLLHRGLPCGVSGKTRLERTWHQKEQDNNEDSRNKPQWKRTRECWTTDD